MDRLNLRRFVSPLDPRLRLLDLRIDLDERLGPSANRQRIAYSQRVCYRHRTAARNVSGNRRCPRQKVSVNHSFVVRGYLRVAVSSGCPGAGSKPETG